MTVFKNLHECQAHYTAINEAGLNLLKQRSAVIIKPFTTLEDVASLGDDTQMASDRVFTEDGKFMLEWDWLYDGVEITILEHAMQRKKRDAMIVIEPLDDDDDTAVKLYLQAKAKEYKSIESFMDAFTKTKGDTRDEAGGVLLSVREVLSGNQFSPHAVVTLPRLRRLPDELSVKDLHSILVNGQYGFLAAKDNGARIKDILAELRSLMSHNASIRHYTRQSRSSATAIYQDTHGNMRDIEINLALR